jgi:hypothetical protein
MKSPMAMMSMGHEKIQPGKKGKSSRFKRKTTPTATTSNPTNALFPDG